MPVPAQQIEAAVHRVKDQSTFLRGLLAETLDWPIPEKIDKPSDLGYGWTDDDLRTQNLKRDVLDGQIWQFQLQGKQPWGIFVVEFAQAKVYRTVLRRILRGLVPSRRRDASLPTWKHDNLLFICATKDYENITFAHFRGDKAQTARLATFGWQKDDRHLRTLCQFNLPALEWPEDGGKNGDAWLKKWAGAFDVETVTKRFFSEYADVFHKVEESVKGVPIGEARRLYTQRLFNRLLFLYFIQRKGWLSFQGDKNYLRALFNVTTSPRSLTVAARTEPRPSGSGEDFLNERLYWAFFYGLNTANEDDATHSAAELLGRRGEVPFLNGGLFDLEDDYDALDAVTIPNQVFAAILDLFERYNFTVAESTPFDVEVAVDPEMLGKVFEELVTGRHESGSYYTPRPIVAFMCRESLKHYLQSAVEHVSAVRAARVSEREPAAPLPDGRGSEGIARGADAIARFVDDNDPSGLTDPEAVLAALKRIKVCDPACGSGAYLLGMMQELLRLREALFAAHHLDQQKVYDRKLEIIQNNLYGVDIDLFAVNIAKLRLWLSLAVDFTGTKPPPLPNLDFKIECGDSLTAPNPQELPDLFRNALVEQADKLADLKGQFIQTYGAKKKKLAEKIKKQEAELRDKLPDHSPDGSVDWRVAFAEVFKEGGFDVVVANPPYVRIQVIKRENPDFAAWLKKNYRAASKGNYDLYVVFVERGLQLLHPRGHFAFILPNKFFNAQYGEPVRKLLADGRFLRHVVHFGDEQVFPGVTNYVCLLFLAKAGADECRWERVDQLSEWLATLRAPGAILPAARFTAAEWNFAVGKSIALFERLQGMPLKLGTVADRISQGIRTSANEVYVLDVIGERRGVITAYSKQLQREITLERKAVSRFLQGKEIKAYSIRPSGKVVIIPYTTVEGNVQLISRAEFEDELPRAWEYLTANRKTLESRENGRMKHSGWYGFVYPKNLEMMSASKVLVPDIADRVAFAFDEKGEFTFTSGYGITLKTVVKESPQYLLALLNSRLIDWFWKRVSTPLRGGFYRFFTQFIEQLPISPIDFADGSERAEHEALVKLASRIVKARGNSDDVSALESEVNERVYRLFGLTREEIAIVEEAK